MIYETKQITLKDGRTATLRSPTVADAGALVRYLKDTAAETPFLLRSPGESSVTVEQEEAYLRSALSVENKTLICCEVDGEVAGTCQFERKSHIKNRHRGMLGIALVRKFWGLGIGRAMFEEMLRLAKEQGMEQLELEVFEGNERAIALYEKMGFRTVGAVPNAIRLPDGRVMSELYMVREL